LDRGKVVQQNEKGEPLRVIGTHTDITEMKHAQQTLLDQKVFIQTILDHLPVGVAINSFDSGEASYMNEQFAQIYGWPKEELLSVEQFFKLVFPDEQYRNTMKKKVMEDISSGDASRMRWENINITTKGGEKRIITAINIPLIEQNVMVSTVQDFTVQKQAEQKARMFTHELEIRVAERTGQLQESNKELEAFSYSVSHDLRAPLRAIMGFAQIIEADYKSILDKEGLRLFKIIQENARMMDDLINNLLEFSRVSRAQIKKSRVNMNTIVQGIVKEMADSSQNKSLKFVIDPIDEAFADNFLIKQVWINLISNAVKFSSPKKEPIVEVGSYLQQNEIIYYVRDNGVGFNPDYYDKLFTVFQRLHAAQQFEGTGLGLAIVQRIITRHNGRVWAQSEPGKGACFYFSLPLHAK
jgi:PAS domain S-box-containing protein